NQCAHLSYTHAMPASPAVALGRRGSLYFSWLRGRAAAGAVPPGNPQSMGRSGARRGGYARCGPERSPPPYPVRGVLRRARDNLRSYPVYMPGREPDGYWEMLRQVGPKPLIEPDLIRTEADWIELGRRVFEEATAAQLTTFDPQVIANFRS